jgi:predicted enzyme related to lactoylglutathione lyase
MLGKATTVLPAEDLARAKAFYTDKVGLSIMFESPAGIAFQCTDETGIFVYPHERTRATHTAATFIVSDVDAEMRELRGRGVVFEEYDQPGLETVDGVSEDAGVKGAWFVDTEGNITGLAQM